MKRRTFLGTLLSGLLALMPSWRAKAEEPKENLRRFYRWTEERGRERVRIWELRKGDVFAVETDSKTDCLPSVSRWQAEGDPIRNNSGVWELNSRWLSPLE